MPRRSAPITVERVNLPDPVAAADAILPLFLAFVEGRGARRQAPEGAPARVHDEARGALPAVE